MRCSRAHWLFGSALGAALFVAAQAEGGGRGPDLKQDGAFGFPQRGATVLCDTPALRVSAANDAEHLYVQAVVFGDGDETLGETDDGREIGDHASLIIDVDGDGKETPDVDRRYSLNPWPSLLGLHYQIIVGVGGASTGLLADSKGRGAVSYVNTGNGGPRVRVDSFLVPLAELNRKPGDTIRIAYHGSSTVPELTVNSVGYEPAPGKRYYPHHLPPEGFHGLRLTADGAAIDIQQVPEGRGQIAVAEAPTKPMPEVGDVPPEVAAGAWLNWGGDGAAPPSLAGLRGKVVVVEFWATWCGPCVAEIPRLNALQEKHGGKGLVVLSLTDQKKEYIEAFMAKTPMRGVVGVRSRAAGEYGVRGIPQAFVIGRDGKVAWRGHPMEKGFEGAVEGEVGKR